MDPPRVIGPPAVDRRSETRHLIAVAGDDRVQVAEVGKQPGQDLDQHLEALLRRQAADAEQDGGVSWNVQAFAPGLFVQLARKLRRRAEHVGIDAVGDHARQLAVIADSLDSLDELGRASGEKAATGEGPTDGRASDRLLSQKDVAAVKPDGDQCLLPVDTRPEGYQPVRRDPVSVEQVVAFAPEMPGDGLCRREQVQGSRERRARSYMLVRGQTAAVAQDLQSRRGV